MEINGRIHKFLSYIGEPMSDDDVLDFFQTHNIKHERIHLFRDFTISLMKQIINTYLGDDVTNKENQLLHFKWCWNRIINDFKTEKIDLDDNELFEYFKYFTDDIFYSVRNKNTDELTDNIILLWEILFDFKSKKTKPDLDMLLHVYKLFTTSLEKNTKNIKKT